MLSPEQRITLRAAETRLALETARHRCRMYLADPASDSKSAEGVLLEVLGLLENAPEPVVKHRYE